MGKRDKNKSAETVRKLAAARAARMREKAVLDADRLEKRTVRLGKTAGRQFEKLVLPGYRSIVEGMAVGLGERVRASVLAASTRECNRVLEQQGRLAVAFEESALPNAKAGHDGHTPEFVEARDLAGSEGKRDAAKSDKNINCDRVNWLYEHRSIEQRQFDAAVRLQRDWETSQILPVASLIFVGGGGGNQLPNDAKCEAMKRHGAAKDALGRDWPIVELVVHEQLTVEKAANRLHINHREAAGRLWSALHHLADHYDGMCFKIGCGKFNVRREERSKIRGGDAIPIHPFKLSA